MKTLKIAIAGAGAISEFHLKGWREQDGIELCAICDPDPKRAQARADEFGIRNVFADTETMLLKTRPDAVDIITPVNTHAPLVRLCADLGIDVMCQKPMTPTVPEAEALIEYVGDRVRFMVHENYRFRPHYAEVGNRIQNGELGKVRHARLTVRSSSVFDYGDKTPFLLGRQPYFGVFTHLLVFEVLIHHLDALRSIFGEMTVVAAALDRINPVLNGEDAAVITLRSEDGVLIVIDANISALGYPPLPTDRLEVLGEADTLVLDRETISLLSRNEPVTIHDLQANYQACFSGAVREFANGLRTGAPFATDRLDNLKTLRLMSSVYEKAGNPL
ncbi:MAG: Gfo/Idh/MocA family protein [Pelagimonas sp.]|uniref:Gfo/Idh/MocA family protein n=1 Tax=Pelagimonas sp. TaxID=2073170 RepID=UPI003D6B595E